VKEWIDMKSANERSDRFQRVWTWAVVLSMVGLLVPLIAVAEEGEAKVLEALEARQELFQAVESSKTTEALVQDELGRGTPRSSFLGISAATWNDDYERAARYLDLSQLPAEPREDEGPMLARKLRAIFSQFYGSQALVEMVDALGTSPQGRLDDGLPARFERFGLIPSRTGEVELLMERTSREDGTPIWKISARSVGQLPRLWEEYGYRGLEEFLPRFFFRVPDPHMIQPWQWIGLALLAATGALLGWLLARALRSGLPHLRSDFARRLARFAPGPVGLFFGLWIFTAGTDSLQLAVDSRTYVQGAERLVLAVALTWIAVRVADLLLDTLERRVLRQREASLATMVLPTLRRVTQALIVSVALILFLDALGFNVTALVAGLGVGGLALALAAQKTIENLIGGVTLYADQPVRVGDLCRSGEILGTVEAIGLRSTRIRTFDRSVVSVPNAEFVNLHLDNLSRRDQYWFHPKLGLRYETTPDQLRYVLVEIRKLLYGHPRVDNDRARVRFTGFGDFSLDLGIFAYVRAIDYPGFLEVAEDLNLRIMGIVEEAGSSFAFPSQTTYLEQGSPMRPEAAKYTGERVQEWREKNELFLPRFPRETIDTLSDSVDYPPTGSPDAAGADT
jgi:MscS family membrane protein